MPRVANRYLTLALRIEENPVVAYGKDARQFVGHHHDRSTEAVAQFEDQVVEQPGADRVKAGRRLVE